MVRRPVSSLHMQEMLDRRGMTVFELLGQLRARGVKMTARQVHSQLAGTTSLSLPFAAAFCDVLDCSFDDIFTVGFIDEAPPASPSSDIPRIGMPDCEQPPPPPLRPLN